MAQRSGISPSSCVVVDLNPALGLSGWFTFNFQLRQDTGRCKKSYSWGRCTVEGVVIGLLPSKKYSMYKGTMNTSSALPWLEKSDAQVQEVRVFSWFRYHSSFNVLWESGFCISVELIMLKGTCKSSHLRSQWVGRNQCSIHSWKKCVLHSSWVGDWEVRDIRELLQLPGESCASCQQRGELGRNYDMGHEFDPQLAAEQCS